MKLNLRQKKFCEYYVASGNATESAKLAGYKGKNLNNIASENLAKLGIRKYIEELNDKMKNSRIAKAEEVLEFLTDLLRGKIKEEVIVNGKSQTITKEADLKDRVKAAELLGKRYMLFTDKVNITGAVPVMIVGEDTLEE